MDAEISESMFASYLKSHDMDFVQHFKVCNEKNVDFKISTPDTVLCDVKEVHNSRQGSVGEIDAWRHIREDLKSLRKKFGREKSTDPIVLITMNFSSNYFTAHTIARAMFGDVGVDLVDKKRSGLHHLRRSNASMTKSTNTSISGIFVYDCDAANHTYFYNEFAKNQIPTGFFPDTKEIYLKRNSNEQVLTQLSRLMFWGRDENKKP